MSPSRIFCSSHYTPPMNIYSVDLFRFIKTNKLPRNRASARICVFPIRNLNRRTNNFNELNNPVEIVYTVRYIFMLNLSLEFHKEKINQIMHKYTKYKCIGMLNVNI